MFEVTVYALSISDAILKNNGLEERGKLHRFLAEEIMRVSDPYVPADEAMVLKSSAFVDKDCSIVYEAPYARYHWFGKLMVDPITGKGAFYNPNYGFWSRPNTPKVLTDRTMQYRGSPIRGPHWVERAWADNQDSVIAAGLAYFKEFCNDNN